MPSLKNINKNIRMEKVFLYFKDLTLENVLVMLLLTITLLVLMGNILRVIANARSNYEIFSIEAQGLRDLTKKNTDLQKELDYVSSDEYKMLLLRNSSNLALVNEELYTIRNPSEQFDEENELLIVKDKTNFSGWWELLIGFIISGK